LIVGKVLESLNSALGELEAQSEVSRNIKEEIVAKKIEKSAIPRRQVSVSS
jgi:hypothetical protein